MPNAAPAGPWTEGPRELLQHAAEHMALGGDFDRRIAMISIDNAVELAVKTCLGLPERARGYKGPGRRELEEASESFPQLLTLLDKYAAHRLTGLDLGDIEWHHRLRNQLYHSGSGITAELARVETYFHIACTLFENLFDTPPWIDDSKAIHTKTGEFMGLWQRFETSLRAKLPPKEGELAYYWKRGYMESISADAAAAWDALRQFRNGLVHELTSPSTTQIDEAIKSLRRLMGVLGLLNG